MYKSKYDTNRKHWLVLDPSGKDLMLGDLDEAAAERAAAEFNALTQQSGEPENLAVEGDATDINVLRGWN